MGRAWELLVGCMLALIHSDKKYAVYGDKIGHILSKVFRGYHKHIASIAGLICIISNMLYLRKTCFPGYYALLPIFGSLLVISAGPNAFANKYILSRKPFVWVGLISYPLYLWHWPLLSFVHILEDPEPYQYLINYAVLLSFILSFLTYKIIEKPIRFSKSKKLTPFLLAVTMVSSGLVGNYIYSVGGLPERIFEFGFKDTSGNPSLEKHYSSNFKCEDLFEDIEEKMNFMCRTNSLDPNIFVIGDSHVPPYGYGLTKFTNKSIAVISDIALLPIMGYINYNTEFKGRKVESAHNALLKNLNKMLQKDSLEYVVLVARGPIYLNLGMFREEEVIGEWRVSKPEEREANKITGTLEDNFVAGYVNIINAIVAAGKKPIFVIDYPELGISPESCQRRYIHISDKKEAICNISKDLTFKRQELYRKLVKRIAAKVPSLIVYDATEAFSKEDICYGDIDNTMVYIDQNHLTTFGSEILVKHFIKTIGLETDK